MPEKKLFNEKKAHLIDDAKFAIYDPPRSHREHFTNNLDERPLR